MAQERLSMRPHIDGIGYHCLLEILLICQLLNLVLKHIYLNCFFLILGYLYHFILFRHIYYTCIEYLNSSVDYAYMHSLLNCIGYFGL